VESDLRHETSYKTDLIETWNSATEASQWPVTPYTVRV